MKRDYLNNSDSGSETDVARHSRVVPVQYMPTDPVPCGPHARLTMLYLLFDNARPIASCPSRHYPNNSRFPEESPSVQISPKT